MPLADAGSTMAWLAGDWGVCVEHQVMASDQAQRVGIPTSNGPLTKKKRSRADGLFKKKKKKKGRAVKMG